MTGNERHRETQAAQQKSGLRIPGFAQLQRLGKSLMLPIAVLPAAGILLRLGQDDLLGKIKAPVIGPFFQAMSAAGGAMFDNLPLLFAVGVAIGFAKKADGSTAFAAVVGYLVVQAVFKTMSPIVLAGEVDKARRPGADRLQRTCRHLRRPAHRVAVRPIPHHSTALVPRILRRQAVRPDRGVGIFSDIGAAHIIVDMIVQNASIDGTTDISFTIHEDELENARTILMPVLGELGAKRLNTASGVAKLSVVGIGMRSHSGVAARLFACLGRAGINIQMVSTSEIKIAVIIDEKEAERAARLIHAEFGLGRLLPADAATQPLA